MRSKFMTKHFSLIVTCFVFLLLYAVGSMEFRNFFSARVFFNFMYDGGPTGIMAIGMTLVILTGGIDLSVSAVMSTIAMYIGYMDTAGYPPEFVLPSALLLGVIFGAFMGFVIQVFDVAPFIVTLAGQFFARGMGYYISLNAIPIKGEFYEDAASFRLLIPGTKASLSSPGMLFLSLLIISVIILKYTRFGRNVYALGGNEKSALFMGIPVTNTKIMVYAFSGFCSALAGVAYSLITLSGSGIAGMGGELDAIAAVVIGGTIMSGGIGTLWGTFVGVLILGTITTMVTFHGELNSAWTKIFIGLLLFGFIFFQNIITKNRGGKK